jgi:integrase/recombinase XerC
VAGTWFGGPDIASISASSDTSEALDPTRAISIALASPAFLALAEGTNERLSRLLRGFAGYLQAHGVVSLDEVLPDHAAGFVSAPTSSGHPPSIGTRHFRRSGLRLLLRVARALGLANGDPTIDLDLPPRSPLPCRPLTDEEMALCRSFAAPTMAETRQPAALALAEATARTSELPSVRATDVDLGRRLVRLPGSVRIEPRLGRLTEWGAEQLERRIFSLRREPERPLVYAGSSVGQAPQISSCIAISQILRRAGLASEPDIRPLSVSVWAGRRALDAGQPIEVVARLLGARSLDRAARLVGWNWRDEGEEP